MHLSWGSHFRSHHLLRALVLLSIAFLSLQLISPVSAASWTYSMVDELGDDGAHMSIAVDSNQVSHAVYYDYVSGQLRYAENSEGSWTITVLESAGNCGEYCDIAIDSQDGVHVSYLDRTNGDLKYAYRSSSSSSWTKTVVDDGTNLGYCTSIAIDSNDKVHISYVDMSSTVLKYATNAGGSWLVNNIDLCNSQCSDTSLDVDSNGKAHIAYQNSGNCLYYTTNAGGTFVPTLIDDTANTSSSCSLVLDSNEDVHIAYSDESIANKNLMYATNATGTWTTSTVATTGNVGRYCSLAIGSGDVRYITYFDDTNYDIMFAENSGSGWTVSTIDSGSVHGPTSIAVGPGNSLHMLYYLISGPDLRYACQPASITWGPEFTSHPADGWEAIEYSYSPTFNVTSTITAHSTDATFLAWNSTSRSYEGTPGADQAGTYWISITASIYIGGPTTVQNETFTVSESWAAQFENEPMDGRETHEYTYEPELNETVTFTAYSTDAPFLEWNGTAYVGTPSITHSGTYWMSITVRSVDGAQCTTQNSSFTIIDAWAPTVTNSPGNGQETVYYSYTVTFNETGARVNTYDTNAPFLTSNVVKGIVTTYYFRGTPDTTQAGTYWLNITVESSLGTLTTYVNSTFTINDTWAPAFNNTPADGQETVDYTYEPTFNETANVTAYSTDAPFLTWNGTAYVGTPDTAQAGTYWINISATSVNGLLTSYQNTTFVIDDSWAPTINNSPGNGQETVAYTYTPSFNETVSMNATTDAAFLSWDGTKYTGTPGTSDAGTYWINITAMSVNGKLTAYRNTTITIRDSWAPTINNSPGNGQETVYLYCEPTFNETVGSISFNTNADFLSWHIGSRTTGHTTFYYYSGTPGTDDAGTYWVNVSAVSTSGKLLGYTNTTIIIMDSWAPTINNSPGNGQETVDYTYEPTFNETATITAHSTDAPFLSWNGTAYVGAPGTSDAGTYWLNITATSVLGKLTSYHNVSFTIGDSWAADFTNAPGDSTETLYYSYEPTFNETVNIMAHGTNAPFLTWDGNAYVGNVTTSDSGVYWINVSAVSVNGKLTSYLNATFTVYDSWAPSFNSTPVDGQETVLYLYDPSFNETVLITAYSTNAPFLTWYFDGERGRILLGSYEGTPGQSDAGTYWINITAMSLEGLQSTCQNVSFTIGESWAPSFNSTPANGQETVLYEYVPELNETANITAHGTDAAFLEWNGTAYVGTPGTSDAGTYWINITVYSIEGLLTGYQNSTMVIGESWAPTIVSEAPEGPFFATLDYEYVLDANESVVYSMGTDAPFLTLVNGTVSGTMVAGTYHICIAAFSVNGLLTSYQNSTLIVVDDDDAPIISILMPDDGSLLNSSSVLVRWNASDAISGTSGCWMSVDGGNWIEVGAIDELTMVLADGTHSISIRATDLAGNEANKTVNVSIDTAAPTAGTSPTGDDVPLNSTIVVEFSEGMDHDTTSITIGGVTGTVSWDGNMVMFTPAALDYNSEYEVTVTGTDLAGNAFQTSWTFSTPEVGDISGVLKDMEGQVLANANLTLSNGMTAVSDANGSFSFSNVPIGNYTLTVELEGYEPTTFDVNIETGGNVQLGNIEVEVVGNTNFILVLAFLLPSAVVFSIVFLILRKRKGKDEEDK